MLASLVAPCQRDEKALVTRPKAAKSEEYSDESNLKPYYAHSNKIAPGGGHIKQA